MSIEINCLCGALRLRISAEPLIGFWCHCADCRAAHGAAYVGVALYPSDGVEILSGQAATFTIRDLPRAFCPHCGVRMFARVPGTETTGIVAARLPADVFSPAFHIHCSQALAPVRDDLPHYRDQPAVFGGTDTLAHW